MASALELLEARRYKGERVSDAERWRLRLRKKGPPLAELELLRYDIFQGDFVRGWEDWSASGFRKIWGKVWRESFKPPPALSIAEWADRYRNIAVGTSAAPGRWDTRRVPFMREPMEACSSGHPCKAVVVVKGVQMAGTECCVLNVIGHAIDIYPRNILLCMPTLESAEAFSRERLEPMLQGCARVAARVIGSRQTVRQKFFTGGAVHLVGANSVSGLSSRALPMTIMDEVDACIANSAGSGNPVKLLAARTTTFAAERKEIFLGSPINAPDETGVLQMWADSSRGQLETACPDCGAWQVLAWERMDTAEALLACTACGVYNGQHAWQSNRADALRWVHEAPEHPTQGFWLSGLNSPWLDWERDICGPFKEASRLAHLGDDSLLRVFYNTKLARAYRAAGRRITADLYHERREEYACHAAGAEVPKGVLLLTAAVDVMDAYLSYEVVGWGRFRESWGIEAGDVRGDPRAPAGEVWAAIDKFVTNRLFRYEDGRFVRPRLIFVDSGGHCTTEVYRYCRARQPRVFAIKGVGGESKPIIIGGRSRERSEGAWLLRLGVDTLKDEFHSRLEVAAPGPGFCHWPRTANGGDVAGYTQSYFDQLTAEERTLKYTAGGFARYTWNKNRSAANEAFDTRCYNRAALEYLKARLEQMAPDVAANIAPDAIEEIELGYGRRIVNMRPGTKRQYPLKGGLGPTSAGVGPGASAGQYEADPAPKQAQGINPPRGARYGAAGSSF